MKRSLTGLLVILLVISLFACQAKLPTMDLLMEQAHAFSAHEVPEELVEQFAQKRVNLLGESHWLHDTEKFYERIIPFLHEQGVRMIMLEQPVMLSFAMDHYVRGELATFPWRGVDSPLEKEKLIEPIHKFNETLRESGRADEQFRLLAFDIDHTPKAYYEQMIYAMKRLDLHYEYSVVTSVNKKFLDKGISPGMTDQLNEDFAWYLDKQLAAEEFLTTFNPMYDGDIDQNKVDEWSEFREAYITDSIEYFLKQLPENQKMLIITGREHAQKQKLSNNPLSNAEPLAKRLMEHGFDVHSTGIHFYEMQSVNLEGKLDDQFFQMEISQGDLIEQLKEKFGNRPVWIAVDQLPPSEYTVREVINDETIVYEGNIQDMFDTLIFFPSGTLNPNQ